MPLLSIAQNQNNGWLPKKAIEYVASFLEIPEIKVLEIDVGISILILIY